MCFIGFEVIGFEKSEKERKHGFMVYLEKKNIFYENQTNFELFWEKTSNSIYLGNSLFCLHRLQKHCKRLQKQKKRAKTIFGIFSEIFF